MPVATPNFIIVGGMPGSGTRAVMDVLAELGVKAWGDDNWDSALGCCQAVHDVVKACVMAEKPPTLWYALNVDTSNSTSGIRDTCKSVGLKLGAQLADYYRVKLNSTTALFGAKEPELFLQLPHLVQLFGRRLYYVHAIRDGRDVVLSYSARWTSRLAYAVKPQIARGRCPQLLDIWRWVNVQVLAKASATLGSRFLAIHVEDLLPNSTRAMTRRVVSPMLDDLLLTSLVRLLFSAGLARSIADVREAINRVQRKDLGRAHKGGDTPGFRPANPNTAFAKWMRHPLFAKTNCSDKVAGLGYT